MGLRRLSEALREEFIVKARRGCPRIVFPEGTCERVVAGAMQAGWKGACRPILVGPRVQIADAARRQGLLVDDDTLSVDPATAGNLREYALIYKDLRERIDGKAISEEAALRLMRKPLYYAAMMVRQGEAAGMVAGAEETTANVITAAMAVIRLAPGASRPSSAFLMTGDDENFGDYGAMMFADCALNPDPDAQTLAQIAIDAAKMFRSLLDNEPRVALLSFSTAGSARHPMTQKVRDAGQILSFRAPDLKYDAEVQFDAALVPAVAKGKFPKSVLKGRANVLVFPDLHSANIGYKLAERLCGYRALGPFLLGFGAPVSDLSRGCSADDVAEASTILASMTVGEQGAAALR